MSELETVQRTSGLPATVSSLSSDLANLGIAPGMVLLVHASLSALGWVCGGPVAIILALEDVLGPDGTLIMPTHSGDLSDPKDWENPPVPEAWWELEWRGDTGTSLSWGSSSWRRLRCLGTSQLG